MSPTEHIRKPLCRFCGGALKHTFVDLGMSPLCESFVSREALNTMEAFYPLHVFVCDKCFLVQLEEFVSPREIFSEYAYFSSYSDAFVEHARTYVHMITQRLELSSKSFVVELASNDGYLLQHFVAQRIPVLGIEPAANVAKAAIEKSVPTLTEFFGTVCAERLAGEGRRADLVVGNNVLAQVPNLNDFVSGVKILLKPQGVATFEFPHLMNLIRENQFDTIYHEHFSYFSFLTAEQIFKAHGIELFDVEEIWTHGGSLRIYGKHVEDTTKTVTDRVRDLREREEAAGFRRLETYSDFGEKVKQTKRELLEFLIRAKREGKSVAGYGAPGKGNTLLNYCGIRTDFIEFTVDRNTYKHGKFLPGTHIPIFHPAKIREMKPDYVLILPWNLKDEIMEQIAYVKDWGARFVIPIPTVTIID